MINWVIYLEELFEFMTISCAMMLTHFHSCDSLSFNESIASSIEEFDSFIQLTYVHWSIISRNRKPRNWCH